MANRNRHQLLRVLAIFTGLLHIAMVVFYTLYPPEIPELKAVLFTAGWWIKMIASFILIVSGILLAWGLKQKSYHVYLAFFLTAVGSNLTFYFAWPFLPFTFLFILFTISFWLSASLFLYSTLRFSGTFPVEAYREYFKRKRRPRWYKKFIVYFTDEKHFWFILSPSIALLYITCFWTGVYVLPILGFIVHLFVMMMGIIYFRMTYDFSNKEDRNKLNWLLWGLICTTTVYCIILIWQFFFPKYFNDTIAIIFSALFHFIICFSVIMTVFFAGATDAGLVVKKTILYSILLLTGLLAYGFIEHFLIHFLAHELHLESGVLSSILGAGIAFLLRPLHHRVEYWLNHLMPAVH